jgi:hypothetical protein
MDDKYNLLIKDLTIEPYFIRVKETNYEIYKNIPKENKTDFEQFKGCYTNFQGVILEIARLKCFKPGAVVTLKEYLVEYGEQVKLITNNIPEIKI